MRTTRRSRSCEPDGSFVGFDVDVGTEIAKRLGVEAEFQHVDWDIITAGSWQERWDISVGSMTDHHPAQGGVLLHPAVLLHPGSARR